MSCNSCGCATCNCIGLPGPKGDKGDQGDPGQPGAQGNQGQQGIQGAPGQNGQDGDNGLGYGGLSTTNSNILDTGSVSFTGTMTPELAYQIGTRVRFADTSNPVDNYFEGVVTSYDLITGNITVADIDNKKGSGTINSWNVSVAGDLGDQGVAGSIGLQGPQGLPGVQGPDGPPGTDGVGGRGYDAISNTSTDILDTNDSVVTLIISSEKAYSPGARVRVSSSLTPANFFEGEVVSYNVVTGEMVVGGVTLKSGSGTFSSWNINLTGEPAASTSLQVFSSYSIAPDQQPVGLGDANKIQVEFGPASAGSFYNLNSNGLLTITQDGRYEISISLQFGRTGGTSSATLLGRVLVGGVPAEPSIAAKLNNQNTLLPFISRIGPFDFLAGTTVSVEIMRFNGANDSGGLFSQSSGEASWADARTAEITLRKY